MERREVIEGVGQAKAASLFGSGQRLA